MPIGAIIGAGALAAGGTIASGALEANASKSAAQTQAASANKALNLQTQIYNNAQPMFAPYRALGQNALTNLQNRRPILNSADPAMARQQNPGLTLGGISQYAMQPPRNGGAMLQPQGAGGMVTMKSPTGQVSQVPQNLVQHYQGLGATVVGG